jgi:hypothetical protein
MIRKLPVKVIVPELDTLPINVLLVLNNSATRSHPKSIFNLPAGQRVVSAHLARVKLSRSAQQRGSQTWQACLLRDCPLYRGRRDKLRWRSSALFFAS